MECAIATTRRLRFPFSHRQLIGIDLDPVLSRFAGVIDP
jgi:hypothetical protein